MVSSKFSLTENALRDTSAFVIEHIVVESSIQWQNPGDLFSLSTGLLEIATVVASLLSNCLLFCCGILPAHMNQYFLYLQCIMQYFVLTSNRSRFCSNC